MEIQQPSLRVVTPNLDKIFSLDCFRYNDLKELLKTIFSQLDTLGLNADQVNQKLANLKGLPSTEEVADLKRRLTAAEKNLVDQGKSVTLAHERCAGFEVSFNELGEWKGLTSDRLVQIEQDIEELKARPIAVESQPAPVIVEQAAAPVKEFNLSDLWNSQKWKDLLARIQSVEVRNIEQDDRLTDNELRIQALEKAIDDPLARIQALEARVDAMVLEMNNKVNVRDHFADLQKRADIDSVRALEAGMLKLNSLINGFVDRFADRVDNEKAHKLLQKNLKNLYDLFMSLKGEGNEEDPMFVTKGLACAACAKGVQNMLGFRADHVPWQNFPFKDPGQRMMKTGQGFSKMYTKSQNESQYYGPTMAGGHQSAANLSNLDQNYGNRGSSAGLPPGTSPGRRVRPMTAKVRTKNF